MHHIMQSEIDYISSDLPDEIVDTNYKSLAGREIIR